MKHECLICMNIKQCAMFKDCTCKLYICRPCLDMWNDHTFPVKKCPVCRTIYEDYKPLAERVPKYLIWFVIVYTMLLIIIIFSDKREVDDYE